MKNSCEVVKDLLPLYYDDVCSNESRRIVEEHLLECDTCKRYLDSMKDDFIQDDTVKSTELEKSDALKRIKKKLFRKNVMVSIVSIVAVIILILGIINYQIPISYEDGLLNVDKAYDGVIDIKFNGDNYYSLYALTKTIEKDGINQTVVYMYYTDTILTRYFSDFFKKDEYQFSIGNTIMVDYSVQGEPIISKEDITAVYYLVDNYRDLVKMADEEFIKVAQNAILIWEE
ncbi:zf-HC2 domain-containing protein [Alkaliphilus transvaalensis]|uniref:zf-HC2 domain-containing protein n=1 Tax=Alkaliphilus transvaalensis TaxID=114628 RepID=UPI000688216A|nr:zf-HC2 domain-containing protein [Alkaliphilus transvaalensis]